METINKIKDLIEFSKSYNDIYVKLKQEELTISITMANSITLSSDNSMLELNLELKKNKIMISGFDVLLITDISKHIINNNLFIDINI